MNASTRTAGEHPENASRTCFQLWKGSPKQVGPSPSLGELGPQARLLKASKLASCAQLCCELPRIALRKDEDAAGILTPEGQNSWIVQVERPLKPDIGDLLAHALTAFRS